MARGARGAWHVAQNIQAKNPQTAPASKLAIFLSEIIIKLVISQLRPHHPPLIRDHSRCLANDNVDAAECGSLLMDSGSTASKIWQPISVLAVNISPCEWDWDPKRPRNQCRLLKQNKFSEFVLNKSCDRCDRIGYWCSHSTHVRSRAVEEAEKSCEDNLKKFGKGN